MNTDHTDGGEWAWTWTNGAVMDGDQEGGFAPYYRDKRGRFFLRQVGPFTVEKMYVDEIIAGAIRP